MHCIIKMYFLQFWVSELQFLQFWNSQFHDKFNEERQTVEDGYTTFIKYGFPEHENKVEAA